MRGLIFIILIGVLSTTGCTSYGALVNYNESPRIPTEAQAIINYKPITVQSNDVLSIQVLSTNPLVSKPFNLSEEGSGGGYLVNSEGFIDFPTVGKIKLKGLEIEMVKSKIIEAIAPYFEAPPIVQVRLANFRVNVNGEVGSPGTFSVNNQRMTLIDAITLAGDFTSYSARDSILIIREQDGMRTFGYINFNSPELFNSPYFYLQQNDVLYVKPNKSIVNTVRDPATRFLPWVGAAVSLVALLLSIRRL